MGQYEEDVLKTTFPFFKAKLPNLVLDNNSVEEQ
jgi:hypothetical protein